MRVNCSRNCGVLTAVIPILMVSLLALSGCGSTPTPAPTDTSVPPTQAPTETPVPRTPAPEAQPTAEQNGYQPLSAAACSELAKSMEESLGVKLETSDGPFQDYVGGQSGTGCQAKATGTGADFGDFPDVASKLQKMIEDQGWKLNIQYQADGPSGTAMGFTKDTGLCLLSVNWQPSKDASCPDDQPLAACDLKPEQKLFTIVLNCAQSNAS